MIIVHANARAALVLIAVLFAASAHAQVTFQVNTVADLIDSNINDNVCNSSANTCSLRAALMQTNARVAAGRIDILLPPGVYLLTRPITGANGADSGGLNLTAALGVNQSVYLVGAGAANTIIDGNQLDGVLQIDVGRDAFVQRLTIRNGNRLSPNSGGGILSSNFANTDGGGIFSRGIVAGAMLIASSSVIDNDADHDRDQLGGTGGGIFDVAGGVRVDVQNSLIARNTYLGFFDDDCVGSLNAFGRNLFGTLAGCTVANTAARGLVAPDSIGGLSNNGGPTLTHALLLGSAAINGTLDNVLCNFSTDQRGAPRVAGLRCDVGAYEFGSIVPIVPLIFQNGFEQ